MPAPLASASPVDPRPYAPTGGCFMMVVDLGHRWPKSTTIMKRRVCGGRNATSRRAGYAPMPRRKLTPADAAPPGPTTPGRLKLGGCIMSVEDLGPAAPPNPDRASAEASGRPLRRPAWCCRNRAARLGADGFQERVRLGQDRGHRIRVRTAGQAGAG